MDKAEQLEMARACIFAARPARS